MPAYFARGSGHNAKAQYSERPGDYLDNVDRLVRKFDTARTLVPAPEVITVPGAAVGFIAFGTTHWAITESRDGQMLQLMKLELDPARVAKLHSVRHYNGLPIDARFVTDHVLAQEGHVVATSATVRAAAMLGGE